MFSAPRIVLAVSVNLLLTSVGGAQSAAGSARLLVPASEQTLSICLPAPEGFTSEPNAAWQLVEAGQIGSGIIVSIAPAPGPSSTADQRWQLLANVPPRTGAAGERAFLLRRALKPTPADFRFTAASTNSLCLSEGERPVLVYNHGVLRKSGVPADRARSTYVHPLFGLDGEVLTDDFPKDHYHHRGLFWAWPHVLVGTNHYDLWMIKGIEQRFERWLAHDAGAGGAVLGVANGWYAGERRVMQEQVWLRVFPASDGTRAVDVELILTPQDQPVTLAGAEGKSYGGLTLRFAPRTKTVITTPIGNSDADLPMTRLPWADLTATFHAAPAASGASVFIAPDHPDYPPMWLTRHYGVLCVGWPGIDAKTFPVGEPIRCRYRVWVHRGTADKAALEAAYGGYLSAEKARWSKSR